MPDPLQTLLLAVFPALVIVAGLKDATSFTIPNWISAAAVAAFFPAALASGAPLEALGANLAVGVVALLAGMAMFAAGWIGGGDAKLFAASGLWLGWPAASPFLLVTALAGGAMAAVLLNLRGDWLRARLPAGPAWVERLRRPGENVPYGVAIAVGALFAFPQSTLMRAVQGG